MVASATKSATHTPLHNMSDIGHGGMPFVPHKFHLLPKLCDSWKLLFCYGASLVGGPGLFLSVCISSVLFRRLLFGLLLYIWFVLYLPCRHQVKEYKNSAWWSSLVCERATCPHWQVFKLHCEEGWFNRRTHQLTKFQLRRQVGPVDMHWHAVMRSWSASLGFPALSLPSTFFILPHCQVDESEIWSTFVYRGAWKWEYVWSQGFLSLMLNPSSSQTEEHALHLYNKDLPVVLLCDTKFHSVSLSSTGFHLRVDRLEKTYFLNECERGRNAMGL